MVITKWFLYAVVGLQYSAALDFHQCIAIVVAFSDITINVNDYDKIINILDNTPMANWADEYTI